MIQYFNEPARHPFLITARMGYGLLCLFFWPREFPIGKCLSACSWKIYRRNYGGLLFRCVCVCVRRVGTATARIEEKWQPLIEPYGGSSASCTRRCIHDGKWCSAPAESRSVAALYFAIFIILFIRFNWMRPQHSHSITKCMPYGWLLHGRTRFSREFATVLMLTLMLLWPLNAISI